MPHIKLDRNLSYRKIVILISIIISQFGCQSYRDSETITIASAGKLNSVDPAQANTYLSQQILSSLGDTLYIINEKGILETKLARELPEISNNGLTISIRLREDVLFHDGTRFNASAMKFSLQRFMDIGTLNYIIGGRIKSIETPEEFLIVLNLNEKSTSIISLLTSINLTPISPKAYLKYKDRFLNKRFIGTGPFRLTNFNIQHKRLEPFENYWQGKIDSEGIDIITLSNSTSLFGAMVNKDVDLLLSNSLDSDQRNYLHKISKRGKIKEGIGNSIEIGYITFNTKIKPFDNALVRRGITYSIDRELISKRVSYGLRNPLYSIVPQVISNSKNLNWPRYNPSLARSAFQNAGFCNSNKIIMQLTFRSNVPSDKLLAINWQSQVARDLSDCLEIKLNSIESTTLYRQLSQGGFEAVILDWRGAYPDPEAYLAPLLSCIDIMNNVCNNGEAALSGSFWASEEIQKLLRESDKSSGELRINIFRKIEFAASKAASYLPVWIVKPRAWSQNEISKPIFDANGHLRFELIRRIKK